MNYAQEIFRFIFYPRYFKTFAKNDLKRKRLSNCLSDKKWWNIEYIFERIIAYNQKIYSR